MRSGKSLATCFFKRRNSSGRSFAESRRRAMRCSRLGVLAAARFVGFEEMFLVAEITGLDEIHDAPQIQQPVFQRRAGEREAVLGLATA